MNKKFIIRAPLTFFILLVFSSCSYFTPQSSNEYTVTKKSPLVMPPDMNIAPPDVKKEKNKNNSYKEIKVTEKLSVEDILTGETIAKKNAYHKNTKKNKFSNKNLVNRILKTKASKTID